MTSEEIKSLQYRFSGFKLPMAQLDSTGPSYIIEIPHNYYYGQPIYWQKPYYEGHPGSMTNRTGAKDIKLYPFLPNNENT